MLTLLCSWFIDENNTYVSRMVTLIHTNGDYDKLMQGKSIFQDVVYAYIGTGPVTNQLLCLRRLF